MAPVVVGSVIVPLDLDEVAIAPQGHPVADPAPGERAQKAPKHRLGRVVLLGQTHGHPMRASAGYASDAIDAMGTCPGFAATLDATRHLRYQSSPAVREQMPPTTVAFGTRDLLLLRRSWRRNDQLPVRMTERRLRGCGHLPMSNDPVGVAKMITASVSHGS